MCNEVELSEECDVSAEIWGCKAVSEEGLCRGDGKGVEEGMVGLVKGIEVGGGGVVNCSDA